MGLRDVPARSSSTDPSAFLAALAPLPSAIPTGSDLSTGCSLGPELNTPCRHLSFPLAFPADAPSQPSHFPETYLPTLALPAPPGPSLSSTCRASPTPPPQPRCRCRLPTSFLPALTFLPGLLAISGPCGSTAVITDLLTLAAAASPWCRHP